MRKLVYLVVAVLCIYTSSNSYAQDVKNAKAAYEFVIKDFKLAETGLKKVIQEANHAYTNHLKYDSSRIAVTKVYVADLRENFNHLKKEYEADPNHKDIKKWYGDASSKRKKIDSLYEDAKSAVEKAKQGQ
jgi:hypothetical protein